MPSTSLRIVVAVLLTLALAALWIFSDQLHLGRRVVPGVRLVYAIQVDPDELAPGDLAERMATAVRKRIDPEEALPIVCRPVDAAAIEVLLPATNPARSRGDGQDTLGVADMKRLLRGTGVLEFHILADMSTSEAQQMVALLREKGPSTISPGGTFRWCEVDQPGQFAGRPLETYLDKQWLLISLKPGESMVHKRGAAPWGLNRAYATSDPRSNTPIVGFEFDPQGSSMFGNLTANNLGKPLAIVLDDRVIAAPNINSRIDGHGIITGDHSEKERNYFIRTLNAGPLPASLGPGPLREEAMPLTIPRSRIALAILVVCSTTLLALIGLLASRILRAAPSEPPPLPAESRGRGY